ncbi:uncharacterized protein SAPINGB_P002433 [Magnusiomyces paraingens]|uniref:Uncharacterized protein n=1 Tax=Magnusiomyces paraingens TaxID=2606893 RepID=A0A5E8BJN6_9ASCO|nr:uncharacterized protein SAPINGB_P002433 [Saprochaete ingens]VVT49767.1 unnamed protein product [Saprochaete ingens]
MDNLLNDILAASQSTATALDTLTEQLTDLDTASGMSLLALKNEALLGYVHDTALVLAAQLVSRVGSGNQEEAVKVRKEAIKGAIGGRVVLEKGLRGLESRVAYEIDKALRNYEKVRAKKEKEEQDEDEDENEDEDNEEQDTGDLLAFKPNPLALLAGKKPTRGAKKDREDEDEDEEDEEVDEEEKEPKEKFYRAPKISATLPSTETVGGPRKPAARLRKNEMLEEYLQETSGAPSLEASIGSNIVDSGRSVRSERDRRKEREITEYEENNYTRLTEKTKDRHRGVAGKKRGRRNDGDALFGESWGTGSYEAATKKNKGNQSVWDKAKRRGSRK